MEKLRNIAVILVIIVLLWCALHPARTMRIMHHAYSIMRKSIIDNRHFLLDRLGLQEKKKGSHIEIRDGVYWS